MIHACLPVEARVLAGMITEPQILALCDEVETADFVDMRHVVVLNGIREVQADGDAMSVDSVLSAVVFRALERGTTGILEAISRAFLEDLIAKAPPGGLRTIRKDTARLRKDREFRESLYEAHGKALRESQR